MSSAHDTSKTENLATEKALEAISEKALTDDDLDEISGGNDTSGGNEIIMIKPSENHSLKVERMQAATIDIRPIPLL